ncbi:MAG: DNA-binding response regulator [Caldilineaceae bacterium]|jgi:DNA-binding NarL/FixJ family response regulator
MAHTVHILLYVSSPLIEVGMRTFLRDYPDLQLVHITNDYQVLGQLAQEYQPDITLFFTTPSAPSHIHYLTEYYQQNRAPILLLALVYNRDHFCQALEAGVHGYILFGVDDQLLPNAIYTVAVGGRWFSPTIDSNLFRKAVTRQATSVTHDYRNDITERERQIMQLMARGWSNQQIGQSLSVTERTVRFHVRNIYDKLQLSTRAEVIVWMMKSGQTEL